MSVVKKVAGNTALILGTRAVNTVIGIATVSLLTRFLGLTDFGTYEIIFAYVVIAANIVEFGFRPILTREISRGREEVDLVVGNVMMVKFLLALATVAVVNLMVHFLGQDPRLSKLMLIYSLGIILFSVSVFESTFAANLNVKVPSFLRTAQRILLLALILLVIYAQGSLVHIVIVELVAGSLYLLFGYLLSLKYLKPAFVFKPALWKEFVQLSWPVGAFAVLDQLLRKVDIIILSSLTDAVSVGIYSLAARLTQFLELFVFAVMVSVFPLLCKYYVSEKGKFETLWRLIFKYSMAFITLVCLVIFYVARPLVVAVGGEEFADASLALQLLIWSQIFVYARVISGHIFVAIDQQRLSVVLALLAVIANIVLDYLLIPQMGYLGACWATLISYSLVFPLAYYLKGARPYMKDLLRSSLRPGFALLVTVTAVFLLGQGVILNVLTAVLVYCSVLLLTKMVSKEDLRLIRAMF
ncbi:MAG: flippase [Ignavibacteria bacterium]|nr:flippase [Ignavibacteria bacterium]